MIAYVTVRTQVHALSIDVSDRHLRFGGNRGQVEREHRIAAAVQPRANESASLQLHARG